MLDSVGQIYLASAAIGSIYLAIGVVMGHLHGGGGHGGHIGGHGGGHVGGHSIGHSGSAHAGPGHAGAAHAGPSHAAPSHSGPSHAAPAQAGTSHSGPTHGTSANATHGQAPQANNSGNAQASANAGQGQVAGSPNTAGGQNMPATTASHSQVMHHDPQELDRDYRFNPIRFVVGLMSPMTIACFFAFFGITGLFIHGFFPWLGAITFVPALIIGLLVNKFVLTMLGRAMAGSFVSSEAKTADIIGQVADVCSSIQPGHLGEVVYTINSVRYNAPARAIKTDTPIKRGARVMIADFQDNIALVEPWNDTTMDVDYTPQ